MNGFNLLKFEVEFHVVKCQFIVWDWINKTLHFTTQFLRLLYTLNKPGLRDIVLDICIHEFHDSFRLPLNQNPVE